MKMFIIENVEQLSEREHAGGAIAIVADDIEHATELLNGYADVKITNHEWVDVIVYELANEEEPRVYRFLDAGCC